MGLVYGAVATAIGQGRFRLAGEDPQSLAALARSGGGGLLMGYGLLMVYGGLPAPGWLAGEGPARHRLLHAAEWGLWPSNCCAAFWVWVSCMGPMWILRRWPGTLNRPPTRQLMRHIPLWKTKPTPATSWHMDGVEVVGLVELAGKGIA